MYALGYQFYRGNWTDLSKFVISVAAIVTPQPSDPLDVENFTGDEFQNFLTRLSYFSPGSSIETIITGIKKWLGMDKVARLAYFCTEDFLAVFFQWGGGASGALSQGIFIFWSLIHMHGSIMPNFLARCVRGVTSHIAKPSHEKDLYDELTLIDFITKKLSHVTWL